jgi:3-methyladenine DNA glycosylase AlkC
MTEAFKNLIHPGTVTHAGHHLQRAWSAFDRARFERQAAAGLEGLAFKARAMQLADALETTLPPDFSDAARVIEASLAPPTPLDAQGEPVALSGQGDDDEGLSGWVVWSLAEFVVRRGMGDLPRALQCLHALTQRFTAEFAIRPFIQRHPQRVYGVLMGWASDPSAHVRRLVSEGSRPRLPWGLRLQAVVADPSPSWPLIQALQDDSSAYVRRSVANHLNDIAKDHPDAVAQWVATHRAGASPARDALLRHASRSLVKQGHGPTLRAWGLQAGLVGGATLSLSGTQARVGDELVLQVLLVSACPQDQPLVIDYRVHHVKARGGTSVKVFKGWNTRLAAGEQRRLERRHSLRPVTTRRLYPGWHLIELQVNGAVCASAGFWLLD